MNIINKLVEEENLQNVQSIMSKYVKEIEQVIFDYKTTIEKTLYYVDTKEILKRDNEIDQVRILLEHMIQLFNTIQMILERIGYKAESSNPADVDETSFISQLLSYVEQEYLLMTDFSRDKLEAFTNDLYYITALAEVHYNGKYGKLIEDVELTEEENEILETTDEYLESLPKIDTSIIS